MGDITRLIFLVPPVRGILAVQRSAQKWKIQISQVLESNNSCTITITTDKYIETYGELV